MTAWAQHFSAQKTGQGCPTAAHGHIRRLWHFPASFRRFFSFSGGLVISLALAASLAGCNGGLPPIKVQLGAGDRPPAFGNLIAADEPQAVLAAQKTLQAGGNAVDAAVTLGFALAVTYPSSAGLGGGGACVVHDSVSGVTEALDFTLRASSDNDAARFRAAVPALSRGLFALHAKYGRLQWPQVVSPAENLARFGQTVSRALARDLAAEGGALMNDRAALSAFMSPKRQMFKAGDNFRQTDLAVALGSLRARGPGDFYSGALSREVEDAISASGGTITAQDLRGYIPKWIQAAGVDAGPVRVFALPEGYGGGHFMAAFEKNANAAPTDAAPTAGATGFVVADNDGGAVACTLTMGRAFGLGILPKGTGFLLAPAPDAPGVAEHVLAPVLGVDIAANRIVFAAAAGGAGAVAETAALTRAVVAGHRTLDQATTDLKPGAPATLVNMLACRSQNAVSQDAGPALCQARNDPRGDGYAVTTAPRD